MGSECCHWSNAVNKRHDVACQQRMTLFLCQPNKAQEKPVTHNTPVAMDTRPEPASSSSTAADMVAQLRATDKRAAGTVDDRDMGHGHMENKNDRTSGGWKYACWMTSTTNGSMNLVRSPKVRRTEGGDLDRRSVTEHTHRMPFCHRRRRDSSPKNNFTPRDLEHRCATML